MLLSSSRRELILGIRHAQDERRRRECHRPPGACWRRSGLPDYLLSLGTKPVTAITCSPLAVEVGQRDGGDQGDGVQHPEEDASFSPIEMPHSGTHLSSSIIHHHYHHPAPGLFGVASHRVWVLAGECSPIFIHCYISHSRISDIRQSLPGADISA